MGILKNGILGGVKGKIANLVGYHLNGQEIIREIGLSTKPFTEKQLHNNLKMAAIMEFFSALNTLIQTGFNPEAFGTPKNYHNLAIQHNMPNALKGDYPNVEIDYPKIKISSGNLMQPVATVVTRSSEAIKFTWNTEGFSWPENQDRVMLLAYAPISKEKVFQHSGAMRMVGEELLVIKPSMYNEPLELYISFVSDDRKRAANSLYLGRFEACD